MAPKSRASSKERLWLRLLWQVAAERGFRSASFCAAQEVSEPSFYSWLRTRAQRDHRPQEKRQKKVESKAPTVARHRLMDYPPLFVPVTVAAGAMLIVLERGLLVRVPVGSDEKQLRQLLAVSRGRVPPPL